MSSRSKVFVFRPVAVVLTIVATGVTIALPMLQVGSWITENVVWVLWVVIAVLVVAMLLLVAHLEAVKMRTTTAQAAHEVERLQAAQAVQVAEEATGVERAKAEQAMKVADEAKAALEASASSIRPAVALSKLDQDLAEKLLVYASNPKTLNTLGSFFPYEIPQETARAMEELADLPMTRTAHDSTLAQFLVTLADGAREWLSKLLPLITTTAYGENYTTKLDHDVSEEAYKWHDARTGELGDVGFDLHAKLLAYQKYYASL